MQIEIMVNKPGYEDRAKRFNTRQAIDRQRIIALFEMAAKKESAEKPLLSLPFSRNKCSRPALSPRAACRLPRNRLSLPYA
ncbi:MAG: hypothetical protein K2H69_01655 [Alistipes sp.]|nr:hypothetical protein [Alistipes sp.]